MLGGYGFGDAHSVFNFTFNGALSSAVGLPAAYDSGRTGVLGGLELGYNYRWRRFLIGPALDASWGHLSGKASATGTDTNRIAFGASESSSIEWLSTLRLRAGFLPIDRDLVYLTGGLAVGEVKDRTGVSFATGVSYQGLRRQVQAGWTVGGGSEFAIAPSWRLKLEYLYYDLGATTANGYRADLNFFHTQSDFTTAGQLVRLGLAYRLGDPLAGGADNQAGDTFLSRLTYEFGTGYWYSTGGFHFDAFNPSISNQRVSRLAYDGLHAHAGELSARVEHPTGVFLKGTIGAGGVPGGKLVDNDVPPITTPESRTEVTLHDGSLFYATADLGYFVLRWGAVRLGPLVGYNYFREQLNAFGCDQTGANPLICAPGAVSPSVLDISEKASWHSARLGAAGGWDTGWHGLRVRVEGAWIPLGALAGTDTHWLRLQVPGPGRLSGPIVQTASTHGIQAELAARLPLLPGWELGLGGRYWSIYGQGTSFFDLEPASGIAEPTHFSTTRYGVFAQVNARF